MLSSKHLSFNASTFGLGNDNSSPAGTLLVSSSFFLATYISFVCCFFKLQHVSSYRFVCVWQYEFKKEEKKKPTLP